MRVSSWLEHGRGRKASNCFVPLAAFEANLRAYLARAAAQNTRVIAIAILPASRLLKSKNPRAEAQIVAYNSTLDRLVHEFNGFQVLHAFSNEHSIDALFIDGYHLNGEGARVVAAGLEPLALKALHRKDNTA
jgi:lysophospholipase L1-like esterase